MLVCSRRVGHGRRDIVGDCDFRIAGALRRRRLRADVSAGSHAHSQGRGCEDANATCRPSTSTSCNNDAQGSNQKLSCLQACMVVRSGVSKDECLDHCPVKACSREINGMEFNSCSVCDDVPAHKDAFGDDFKPVRTSAPPAHGIQTATPCEAGCNAGRRVRTRRRPSTHKRAQAQTHVRAHGRFKVRLRAHARARARGG